jgi:hypothetical protein
LSEPELLEPEPHRVTTPKTVTKLNKQILTRFCVIRRNYGDKIFYDITPVLRSRIIFIPLSVPEPSVQEPSMPEPSVPEPSVPEPSAPEPSVPEQELYCVTAHATPYGSGSATLYLTKVNKQHFANANVQNFEYTNVAEPHHFHTIIGAGTVGAGTVGAGTGAVSCYGSCNSLWLRFRNTIFNESE